MLILLMLLNIGSRDRNLAGLATLALAKVRDAKKRARRFPSLKPSPILLGHALTVVPASGGNYPGNPGIAARLSRICRVRRLL